MNREKIWAALFDKLYELKTDGTVPTVSRVWRDPDQVSPSQQPAIFLTEESETQVRTSPGLPNRIELNGTITIYAHASTARDGVPAKEINRVLDAIDEKLRTDNQQYQILGGLVTDCRLDGEVTIIEGLIDNQTIAEARVRITATR